MQLEHNMAMQNEQMQRHMLQREHDSLNKQYRLALDDCATLRVCTQPQTSVHTSTDSGCVPIGNGSNARKEAPRE
jgi:hypothetical protein